MTPPPPRCHICRSTDIKLYPAYRDLVRITSDCRAWPYPADLAECRSCGMVQALCNEEWRREIGEIYRTYSIYSQGGGEEQNVFNPGSGAATSRSKWLLENLRTTLEIPATGRLLEIGCGNGGLLKAFGQLFPSWRLVGTEFDDKYKDQVEALPNVELMHAGDLDELDGKFELISMIHVLEHIENPLATLKKVKRLLSPEGQLLVELPHYCHNPFELPIADHASHFSLATATQLLSVAGFEAVLTRDNLVPKELTLAYRLPANRLEEDGQFKPLPDPRLGATVDWLARLAQKAAMVQRESGSFGIFGSSIAAGWLTASLPQPPGFFVDEDPVRIGRTFHDVPIVSPSNIPKAADVFVPLAPLLVKTILQRLDSGQARFHHLA